MQKQTIDLLQYAESTWYSGDFPRELWLTCYSAMLLSPMDLEESIIELDRAKAIILYGDLPFPYAGNMLVRNTLDGIKIENRIDELWKNTGDAWWVLLIQPYQVPPGTGEPKTVTDRREEVLGMISAVCGRNLCYEKRFEYTISMETKQSTATSRYIRVPTTMPKPDISKIALSLLAELDGNLIALDVQTGTRHRLALRWFFRASEPSGVDSLLYYWIALEVLSMPDTTNVAPLVALLSRGYAEPEQWIRDTFHIGRLCRLRGNIVHDGLDVPIDSRLLDFLEALFVDALYTSLKVPCPKKAMHYLNTQKLNLLTVLPEPSGMES
jgi:hypothetical protein